MCGGPGVRRWRRVGPWAGQALAAFAAVGAAPAADRQAGDVDWLPLAIFGVVVFCVFPLLLACYTWRRRPRVEEDDGMQRIPARAPVRLPVDLAAVHERAPTSRPPRSRDD